MGPNKVIGPATGLLVFCITATNRTTDVQPSTNLFLAGKLLTEIVKTFYR